MKKFIFNSMLLGGLVMTSCSDNVLEKPVTEEAAQSFAELFGKIDPKQDWSLAERKSVTVEVGTSSTVYIYAKNEIAYTLVGQYENVSGTRELKFDAPELTTDFLVSVNGEAKKVANGEKVSFGAKSRGAFIDNYDGNVFIEHENVTRYSLTDGNSVADFISVMDEKDSNNANMEGVHYNFFAVSEGNLDEIANIQGAGLPSVFPLYWNSGMDHELGIYIRVINPDDNSVSAGAHYPIWRSEQYVNASADPGSIQWSAQASDSWDFYVERKTTGNSYPSWGNNNGKYTQNALWRGGGSIGDYYIEKNNLKAIYTRGFDINLPAGTTYGFYLKVWHHWNGNRYQEGGFNGKEVVTWYTDASLNADGDTHAAYFESGDMQNNYKYLCFEDFASNKTVDGVQSDRDFNDLVFVFNPAPIIVTNVNRPWVLALEDLGTTDDYDFNDAVIGIEHIAGQKTARVTPLAVGATLPIYLKFNGNIVGNELHSYWNAEATDDKYPMINTSGAYKAATVAFPEITVGENFSLLEFTENQNGGLSFKVGDGPYDSVNATPPHKGIAPQVICVPWTWDWPRERTRIDSAYPKFTNWVGQAEEDKKNGAIWGNNYLMNKGNWISTDVDTNKVIESPWRPVIGNN